MAREHVCKIVAQTMIASEKKIPSCELHSYAEPVYVLDIDIQF